MAVNLGICRGRSCEASGTGWGAGVEAAEECGDEIEARRIGENYPLVLRLVLKKPSRDGPRPPIQFAIGQIRGIPIRPQMRDRDLGGLKRSVSLQNVGNRDPRQQGIARRTRIAP